LPAGVFSVEIHKNDFVLGGKEVWNLRDFPVVPNYEPLFNNSATARCK